MNNQKYKNLLIILFLVVTIITVFLAIAKPFFNWDVLGYIAATKSFEEKDINTIHEFAYKQVAEIIPQSQYDNLTSGIDYRVSMAEDAKAFSEQLPFYQIRIAYNAILFVLYKIGINIVFATQILSGFPVVASIILLYFMARDNLNHYLALIIPIFILLFKITELAQYSTPDGLALLAFVAVIYLFLEKANTCFTIPIAGYYLDKDGPDLDLFSFADLFFL